MTNMSLIQAGGDVEFNGNSFDNTGWLYADDVVLASTDLNMTGVMIAKSDVLIDVVNSVTVNGTIMAW